MGFFKDLLLKKMLKSQLKGVPEDQQEKIIQAVEKNPKLFSDIAAEVKAKMDGGMDQQSATMQVMMSHRAELQELMK
jgi:methyl coenzyme M reductase alpha subunit